MEEDIKKYGVEWIILEKITKGDAEDTQLIKDLFSYEINWGELMEQAMSHKIFPMLAYFVIENDCFDKVPPFVNQYFRIFLDVNMEKVKKIKEAAIEITKELTKLNIPFVATKGVILDNELYGNVGCRFMSDADFIVEVKNKNIVMETLKSLGYKIGTVNWKNNGIKELSREEYLIYLNTPDKLPEFVKETDNNIIKYVSIGFVCSLTWNKCEYSVDINDALKNIRLIDIGLNNEKIPALGITYHYIYIILHLYKHAWLEFLSRWNNDVNLVKFGDVYRYYKKYKEIIDKELPEIIKKQNIENPVIWTLQHTDEIFGSNIVENLNYENFINDEYLHSAGDKKGNIRIWKGNMRERLKSKNRKKLFI